MVAMFGLLLAHVILGLLISVPSISNAMAKNCSVAFKVIAASPLGLLSNEPKGANTVPDAGFIVISPIGAGPVVVELPEFEVLGGFEFDELQPEKTMQNVATKQSRGIATGCKALLRI